MATGSSTAAAEDGSSEVRRDYKPAGVEAKTGFLQTVKRVFKESQEDNLTDWAAALTY